MRARAGPETDCGEQQQGHSDPDDQPAAGREMQRQVEQCMVFAGHRASAS
jgi:hypothetical protein